MTTPSLRVALTRWFLGFTSLVVGVSAVGLYVGVRDSLRAGLDAELRARAEGFAALCEWEGDTIELEGAAESDVELSLLGAARSVEIRVWPAATVARAFGVPLPDPAADDALGYRTLDVRGEPIRVFGMVQRYPGFVDSGTARPAFEALIRVGDTTAGVDAQLGWIGMFIAGSSALSILLAIGFGRLLATRVTQPLQRLGAAALAVRSGATAPMPRRGNGDEIDRLADVLDATFGALQSATEEQRRFTADASHELRTPVATLQAQVEVALNRERSAAEYVTSLHEMHAVVQRMGRILEALLTLTRLDAAHALRIGPIDVAAVVRDAVAERRCRPELTVDVVAPTDIAGTGDADLLRILVDNLLSNAVRHAASRVRIEVAATGAGTRLVVHDDGAGVPPAERARLFERFFRGANASGHAGAGLGMALVAAVTAAHGGAVRLLDVADGFAVEVLLPA